MTADQHESDDSRENPRSVVLRSVNERAGRPSETPKMRIGLFAPPWLSVPPPAYGGIESVIDQLARGLHAQGHEVLLFATGDSTCPVPRAWLYDEPDARMGSAVVELRHVIDAYELVEDLDLDIVHDHTLVGPLYAERFPHLPVVTTNHGPFNADLRDLYRILARRIPVVGISHAQAAAAAVPVTRVIHHGVDPKAFPVGQGDGGYLLFLGRMTPEKGAHRAAAVARRAGVPLVMAAKMREPAEKEYFDRCVRPLLGPGIEYVGEVGGADKLALLGGARALINPIRWQEPFGLVMIEALACGTPVLAFPEGAAPEIVDDGVTGFLCRDEDDMVRAVGRLGEIDRAACRTTMELRFSTARMVAEHVDLYGEVLQGRWAAPAVPTRRPRVSAPLTLAPFVVQERQEAALRLRPRRLAATIPPRSREIQRAAPNQQASKRETS